MSRSALLRSTALVGLVGAVATASLAGAAPAPLVIKDATGDANAVNGQGLEPGLGDNSGPVQKADSDIVSVTVAALPGKCAGFTATLELAAPAGSAASYRITGLGVKNATQFWLQYSNAPTGATTTIRHNDGEAKTTPISAAKLDGNKVVFTVTDKELKATGETPASFTWASLGADTRTSTGVATVPAWDTLDEDETKKFKPCS